MASGYGAQTGGGGYVSSSSGGAPNASFVSNYGGSAPPKAVAAPNPYANAGKFNVSVVSPQAFQNSMQHDTENLSVIHGMNQAVFGENNQSFLGGMPVVGLAGRVLGNVTDWQAGVAGNVLGGLGKVWNPFSAGYAHIQFLQSADTPEKRAVIAKQDWNPFSILQSEADYLATLRKDNPMSSSSPSTGLSALDPELFQSKDPTAGGFVASLFDVLALTEKGAERTVAGWKGIDGNQLDLLLKKDPATLGATQREAVEKFRSGEWSEDRAIDHLVANNAGLSDDPRINLVFGALIDPLTWGSLGSSLLARGGKVLKDIAEIQRVATEGLAAARAAKKASVLEADNAILAATRGRRAGTVTAEEVTAARAAKKTAIEGADEAIATAEQDRVHAFDELPKTLEGYGRFSKVLARTPFIGPVAAKVMMDETLGPIARVAHNVIDPTRLLFPESDPASQILKSRLSLEMTQAVTHAYNEGDVYRLYALLDKFNPEFSGKVQQMFGEYVGGLTRAWVGREVGRDMVNRVGTEALSDPWLHTEARLKALPNDINIHMEQFAREVTPLSVTEESINARLAAALGGKAEEYAALTKGMNTNQLAYLHAATTAAARSDLLEAIGTQAAKGTWKLKQSIEKLILIGPGELTETRAKALITQLNKLKGADRLKAAHQAVEQYDVLRYSQVITGESSVAEVVRYVEGLRQGGALASELGGKNLASVTGEVGDWLAKYGKTADGQPLYGLGFRPKDENLWRLVRDPHNQKIISMSPWVDYVSERAPGYRPGMSMAIPGAPGIVQKAGDWLAIGRQNLFHEVSTTRVALEAKRRFIQTTMKMGMTESEGRALHGALETKSTAVGAPMRGVSGTDMWEASKDLIPDRLKRGPGAITKRQLVDAVLSSYTNEMHVVGATQILTGKLKQYIDRIPGFSDLAGGNMAGQVAEHYWPTLKFKINPVFILQEMFGENQYFSALKGLPVYYRGAVTASDELAYKIWGTFDKNLEGVGDQIENSTTVLLGHIEGTLEASSGMKRIKYVNAARQFRNTLGEIGRKNFPPDFLSELKAHYNNLNDGEVMLRWLDEQMQANRDVTSILNMAGGSRNAYEDIIKVADWTKPVEQGAVAALHLDTLARRMGYNDEVALVKALRSKTNSLTKSDIHARLQELSASPGYIDRVMHALDWRGVDSWYKAAQKQYKLSDNYVAAHKAMMNASARLRGMSTSEYMSQIVTNKIGVFRNPADLPVTNGTFMREVRTSLRAQGKVLYEADSPEVSAVLTRAQEMRGQSALNPTRASALQRAHDRVNANPREYQPGGPRGRVQVHTSPTGRVTYTGNVGWKETKDNLERHVGLRDAETGEVTAMDAILDSANWYNELPGFVLSMVNGDTEMAAKVLLGFLYTQKATSPVQGMRLILKAADRYNIATAEGMEKFFTEDLQLSKAVTRKVFLGEPITEGLGAKLFDFTDAGLRQPRRFMGLHAPTPSDRWMIRARGYMDESGLDEFLKAYGYKTARQAGYLDPELFRVTVTSAAGKVSRRVDTKAYEAALQRTGLKRVYTGVSDSMYEETTRWTNDMARQANLENNGAGWLGKNNWTGSEMQAAIWVGAQKAVDAYPEAGADMFFHNATQMALEVRPSERGPFHVLQRDWDQMDEVQRTALTDEMASQVASIFSQRLKIPVMAYHTGVVGSWAGVIAPNFTIQIAGTGETIDRAVLSGLAANGQDMAIAVREMPNVFKTSKHSTGLYHAIDFILPTVRRDSTEISQRIARLPSMMETGFMPFEHRGVMRLRSLEMTDKNTSLVYMNRRMETLRQELDAAGMTDVTMEVKGTHVISHEQDWEADPRGLTIRQRLRDLGPGGEHAERQLFGHVGQAGVEQPILGEFRALADDFIRDNLGGDAIRGRSGVGDLVPEAPSQSWGDLVPGLWQENSYAQDGIVELVPLSYLESLPRGNRLGKTDIPTLTEEIKARGIDEPLILDYNPNTDEVRLAEGNHRVAAARRAGLDYLPVRVYRNDRPFGAVAGGYYPTVPGYASKQGVSFVDHVPRDLTPSSIGVPAEQGFANESNYAWQLTHANSKAITGAAAGLMGHPGYATGYEGEGFLTRWGDDLPTMTDIQIDMAAHDLLMGVYESRGSTIPLYSGQRADELNRVPREGDVITMPLKATTDSKQTAHEMQFGYAPGTRDEPGFVYRFGTETRGTRQSDYEVVTSGRFKVTGITTMPYEKYAFGEKFTFDPNIPPVTIVDVRQVEVFNPMSEHGWERVPGAPSTSGHMTSDYVDSVFGLPKERPTRGMIQDAYDAGDYELGQQLQRQYTEGEGAVPGFGVPPEQGVPGFLDETDGTEALKMKNEFVTRGAMTLNKDGRSVLWASQDAADPLTFMHEVAHAAHTHMDPSMSDRLMAQFRHETGSKARKWNRAASEWFADSYIKSVREGVTVADPELQRAFNYFAKWTDSAINKGLLKGEKKGFEARGAVTQKEHTALMTPMRAETKSLFDEMLSGPKRDAHPFNANEEMVWNAMTDAVKEAGYDAFRVNFFKRNRTLLERSVNHPMFGLYPASYMWGKVLPELTRFLVKDPFGLPGGHIAYAANDVQRSIVHQSLIDPEFAKQVDALGKNGLIRLLALMLPATPWEIPVNAPAWARRVAQAGLANEAAAKAGQPTTPMNPVDIFSDTMSYHFGGIPEFPKTISQGLTGAEDLFAAVTGQPQKGEGAPSVGAGLQSLNQAFDRFGAPLGEGLPSVTDVFAPPEDSTQIDDILSQNDALQQELTDAQQQLEGIFTQYPFTQQ